MSSATDVAVLGGDALPLYYRIKSVLEERIRSGVLEPGSQLPSEADLCREFSVSRGTVRDAMRELVQSGLIERRHGKGSFVTPDPVFASSPMKFSGLLEDLYDQVSKVQARAVEIEVGHAPSHILRTLGLRPGTTLTVVRRERHLDGAPFAFTVNYLPTQIGERIDPKELRARPLLRILEERLGIRIDRAEQAMRATLADADVARRLATPFASPVMFAERVYFQQGDRPLQIAHSWYRADRYQFSVNLRRYRKEGKWLWDYRKDE